ncbi:MAG: hypothetical protein M2R45_00861 [Verrucomicrobia subdivision 3 bacterium]|nr:hypothetical protein [Limisphaerales bacterium]MCS1414529.1 hypothetical protein [Limisphaerales bacterium]
MFRWQAILVEEFAWPSGVRLNLIDNLQDREPDDMKIKRCMGALSVLLAFSIAAGNWTSLRADDQGGSEWEVLFGGSSVEKFRAFKGDSFPSSGWKVESGQLRTMKGGDEVDIITKKEYDNFELVFEWKVTPGANSGVMYRVSEAFDQSWHTGPEYQVLDDLKHHDGKNPLTSAGSFYALVSAEGKELKPVGQYNKSRIVVNGNWVEHWLNGKKVVALELGSYAVRQLIAKSKFSDKPRFAQEASGHICFQHHHDGVWFRNIEVRELAPRAIPAPARRDNRVSKAQREAGWRNLFNGENTNRWRGFLKEGFPEKGWVVEEGTIKHLKRGGGGDIVTKGNYQEFDFRFEWKVAPGANSGVKYFILEEERRKKIGHEYQIIDDGKHLDALRGPKWQSAAFYDCFPAKNRVVKPVGEFNASRILVEGDQVEHWLNGVMVLSYRLGSPEVMAAVAKSKFKKVEGFGKLHRGRILLQDHGDEVAYRNLRIKRLD